MLTSWDIQLEIFWGREGLVVNELHALLLSPFACHLYSPFFDPGEQSARRGGLKKANKNQKTLQVVLFKHPNWQHRKSDAFCSKKRVAAFKRGQGQISFVSRTRRNRIHLTMLVVRGIQAATTTTTRDKGQND